MMKPIEQYTGKIEDRLGTDVSKESYETRLTYEQGFRDSLNVMLDYLNNNGQNDIAKELVTRYNEYVVSQDFFGLDSTGGDAYKG